jgi:hypothetical protein
MKRLRARQNQKAPNSVIELAALRAAAHCHVERAER